MVRTTASGRVSHIAVDQFGLDEQTPRPNFFKCVNLPVQQSHLRFAFEFEFSDGRAPSKRAPNNAQTKPRRTSPVPFSRGSRALGTGATVRGDSGRIKFRSLSEAHSSTSSSMIAQRQVGVHHRYPLFGVIVSIMVPCRLFSFPKKKNNYTLKAALVEKRDNGSFVCWSVCLSVCLLAV